MRKKHSLLSRHTKPGASRTAVVLPLRGLCPTVPELTDYDRRNMQLYTWLLILEEDGAGLGDLAEEVFRFDLTQNPAWAIRVTLSHLQRARWVNDQLVETVG